MEYRQLNRALTEGKIDLNQILPKYYEYLKSVYKFEFEFGLSKLPKEEGIILIRGPRQYGKSTWLEENIAKTIEEFGKGSVAYLNGDYLTSQNELEQEILVAKDGLTHPQIKRIFIDEITVIVGWEIVLKRMVDRGKLKGILIITTGSNATDLRRGSERLPGRKGKLERNNYYFGPLSLSQYAKGAKSAIDQNLLHTYLLSGGSPIACAELFKNGRIPEWVISIVRDWIEGEISRSGRSVGNIKKILTAIFKYAGSPISHTKLARELGMANNTVVSGYLEILYDLGCVSPCHNYDFQLKTTLLRKPSKIHFTNLLVAVAYSPYQIRSVNDYLLLESTEKGKWIEWLVAQEIFRKKSLLSQEGPQALNFWASKSNKIDFIEDTGSSKFIEVKSGSAHSADFQWFFKVFPHENLTIINNRNFDENYLKGISLIDFLQT